MGDALVMLKDKLFALPAWIPHELPIPAGQQNKHALISQMSLFFASSANTAITTNILSNSANISKYFKKIADTAYIKCMFVEIFFFP